MLDLFSIFLYPIIYIFPAYAANGAPVLFGGGSPLDKGKKLLGKRIFGDNKTVRGTISGILCGVLAGLIEYPVFNYMFAIGILLALGAILGDLLGSFVKRRFDVMPSTSIPILDQYPFFVVALLLALPLGHLPGLFGIIFLFVLTGILHVLTNMGAHMLKLKKVPW